MTRQELLDVYGGLNKAARSDEGLKFDLVYGINRNISKMKKAAQETQEAIEVIQKAAKEVPKGGDMDPINKQYKELMAEEVTVETYKIKKEHVPKEAKAYIFTAIDGLLE